MKFAAFACAALLALGFATAHAYENCPSHCAEGYTWSPESGSCVPESPST